MTRLTNRNFGQYAWATSIPGGFEIVSIAHPPYQTTKLPERCEESGLEVILCDKAVALFKQVTSIAEQRVGLIMSSIRNALKPLADGLEQCQTERANHPDDANLKVNELGWLLAGCSIPTNIVDEITPLAGAGNRWTQVFNERIGTLAAEVAEGEGLKIKDKAPEFPAMLGFILNLANGNGEFRAKPGVRNRETANIGS